MAQYGGTYLARTATHEQVEGRYDTTALRITIQWPSKQAALDFMADPDYEPHLAARTAGSNSFHDLVDATDDLA